MWAMVWRFGVVLIVLVVALAATTAVLKALQVHPFVAFWIIAAIWLTPMYLANRALKT